MRKTVKAAKQRGYLVSENGELEHREVYKEAFGKIPKGWVIHHIDYDKHNNCLENLIAMPSSLHDRLHHIQRKQSVIFSKVQILETLAEIAEESFYLEEEIQKRSRQLKDAERRKLELGFQNLEARIRDARPLAYPQSIEKPIFEAKTILRKHS